MNVFKKKGKGKDKENVDPSRQEMPAESKMSRSLKRKNKNVPQPKPEIDLKTVLPDTTDFRTSLIMPGLSARFSMLKEQDDPKSLLGKASDDSVLFPKRASRYNLFGNNTALTDIAETESLHSIRKPFAQTGRSNSVSDTGYGSDDGGSMMSRSRPGEGNVLFGGRQKMYRIAGTGARGSGTGRHLYEDDTHTSPWQQWRAKSQDDESSMPSEQHHAQPSRQSEEADTVHSSMAAFSKNRGTTSSTTSGPSNRRTSTAATSVATCDSPIPRQDSGHDSSRLRTSDGFEGNSVSRKVSSDSRRNLPLREMVKQPPMPSVSPTARSLSQSKSAADLKDRRGRDSPAFSKDAFRANSPTVGTALSAIDTSLQEPSKGSSLHTRRYQTASPTNHSDAESDTVYSSNVRANDRGKATAMGLFNRPRQQYDEQQFLQRQRQMHEGRSSPAIVDSLDRGESPETTTSSAMLRINNAVAGLSNTTAGMRDARPEVEHQSSVAKNLRKFGSPAKTEDALARPRFPSGDSHTSNQSNVKARVESLIRRNNAELSAMEATHLSPRSRDRIESNASQRSNDMPHSPYLNRFDSSDDEDEVDEPTPQVQRSSRPPLDEIHPALRNGLDDFDFGEQVSPRLPKRQSESSNYTPSLSINADTAPPVPQVPPGDDSPTLGPNGLGLSGMIRTHLRNDSDRSSFYPHSPTSQFHNSRTSREMSMVSNSNTNPTESVHSDPWEFDNARRSQAESIKHSQPPAPTPSLPSMSQKAQQILGHAAAQRVQASPQKSKAQRILGQDAPHGSVDSIASPAWHPSQDSEPNSSNETLQSRGWQGRDDLEYSHNRNASTETQKERQDFDAKIAERRRRIEEKVKDLPIRDRSMSPVTASRRSNEQYTQPFPGLRSRSSKTQLGGDYSNKAMKMLGLNNSQEAVHQQRPHMPRHYTSSDNEYDEPARERQWSRAQNRPPPAPSQVYASGRRTPHDGHSSGRRTPADRDGRNTPHANSSNEDFERHSQRSKTPNSFRSYGRDRAGSEAAERSKSRNRPYRDERDEYGPRPVRQGSSPSPPHDHRRTPDDGRRGGYERSPSAMSGSRARSNSRPGPPLPHGYYDPRGNPPGPINGPGPSMGDRERDRDMMMPPMISTPNPTSPSMGPPRPSPRPPMAFTGPGLPHSPMPSPFAPPTSALPSPAPQSTAFPPSPAMSQSGPPATSQPEPAPRRRMTVNKNMIGEPTLISTTSSVPLVGLPTGSASAAVDTPPLPAMNPRRRDMSATRPESPALGLALPFASASGIGGYGGSHSAQPSPSFGMPTSSTDRAFSPGPGGLYDNSGIFGNGNAAQSLAAGGNTPRMGGGGGLPPPRARERNRLRKTSSEGGNLASKARQQALMAEMGRENLRSPVVGSGGFARSATSLGVREGGNGHGSGRGRERGFVEARGAEGGMF
jgi:hypothetical protein